MSRTDVRYCSSLALSAVLSFAESEVACATTLSRMLCWLAARAEAAAVLAGVNDHSQGLFRSASLVGADASPERRSKRLISTPVPEPANRRSGRSSNRAEDGSAVGQDGAP